MIIHAAGESFGDTSKCRGSPIYAVALVCKDESELEKLERKLIEDNIQHTAFRDPDWDNKLMAIGIKPQDRESLKKYVKQYKTLR